MASSIELKAGALVSNKTLPVADIKVRDTLLKFYTAMSLGPASATNQEKLDAIRDHLLNYIQAQARQMHISEARAGLETEAGTTYGFE